MKFNSCIQGSEEWHTARAGVITASRFSDAVSRYKRASGNNKIGDMSTSAKKYAYDLTMERISGTPYGDTFQTFAMKRGTELEAQARMIYEATRFDDDSVTEAGLVTTDDGHFGYSTDGLVGDHGLIEIKCPIDSVKVFEMWRTGDVSEYIHQMQGGLWITGRQWCDFIMYCPALENAGKQLYVKRIERDDDFIEQLETNLVEFNRFVIEQVSAIKST